MAGKIEKKGWGPDVERLRYSEQGERTLDEIARLLSIEKGEKVSSSSVKTYLKAKAKQQDPRLVKEARAEAKEAIKEGYVRQSLSSIEIVGELEQLLFRKVEATGTGPKHLASAAQGARAVLDVIKVKAGLMGMRLAEPNDPDKDLRHELESLRTLERCRNEGTGDPSGDEGTGGSGSGDLPN